ncbi:MAG: pantoate--beta-alanine ligase [Lentisphaeria bacterium]|nr:pantoate--beta-alanine ligase [Lentisphaeria bacterium]
MKTITSVSDMWRTTREWRRQGFTIGLVPTMGFLHDGHVSLIAAARKRADRVVVTIFVNPTQFGPNEDFADYPRDAVRDRRLCETAGAAAVFLPDADTFYAPDHSTWVHEDSLTSGLCGVSRPGHFRGVTTVVTKLFNVTLPDIAVFGQKDAQQALVIKRMTRDLNFPVDIVLAPIVREPDGLAMSSRNVRLAPEERARALSIFRGLRAAQDMFDGGERGTAALMDTVTTTLARSVDDIDYVALVDVETLEPVETIRGAALLAVAARVGSVRLIDNCLLGADGLTASHAGV